MARKRDKLLLTQDEEFQLLKLILDKFLWLGTAGIAIGLYMILSQERAIDIGWVILLTGALVLFMFTGIVTREFQLHRGFR